MPKSVTIAADFVYSVQEVADILLSKEFIIKFHAASGNSNATVSDWTPSDKPGYSDMRTISFQVVFAVKVPDSLTSVFGNVEGTHCTTTEYKKADSDTVEIYQSVLLKGIQIVQHVTSTSIWKFTPKQVDGVDGCHLDIEVNYEFNGTYVSTMNNWVEKLMESNIRLSFGKIIQMAVETLMNDPRVSEEKRALGAARYGRDKQEVEKNQSWWGNVDIAHYYGGVTATTEKQILADADKDKQSWGQWASSWTSWATGSK
jgi:hypothetical protein